MNIPAPYTVTRRTATAGAPDSHGDTAFTWTDTPITVYGWAPATADQEPNDQNRSMVIHDVDLYAPPGTVIAAADRIVLPTGTYDVVGLVEDYTTGPWQWASGVRINLKKVDG